MHVTEGIIAEIAGNFKSVQDGVELAVSCIKNGANSVKLQTFDPYKLASKDAYFDMKNTGKKSQLEVFKETYFDYGKQKEFVEEMNSKKITTFSTPSHIDDIEFLSSIDCASVLKIGSDDSQNYRLIKNALDVANHVVISTGMSTISEVEDMLNMCERHGGSYSVMHCVTNYPAVANELNLRTISTYQNLFPELKIGYSDHHPGIDAVLAAKFLGASFFEKHVMLDDSVESYDKVVSISVDQLAQLSHRLELSDKMLGSGLKKMSQAELVNRKNNRKSLFAAVDIKEGERITPGVLECLRPGTGISPAYEEEVCQLTAGENIYKGKRVLWENLK